MFLFLLQLLEIDESDYPKKVIPECNGKVYTSNAWMPFKAKKDVMSHKNYQKMTTMKIQVA